jgi:hypothetical protein
MAMKKFLAALTLIVTSSYAVFGQAPQASDTSAVYPKTTPAYGVLILKKVAVEADLEDLRSKLTSDSQEFKTKRFELMAIGLEMERMQGLERAVLPKLTTTYGNLILRKVALEVELNDLRSSITPEHPDFRKRRTELDTLEREINDMLR